jgi:hypothetical protein
MCTVIVFDIALLESLHMLRGMAHLFICSVKLVNTLTISN